MPLRGRENLTFVLGAAAAIIAARSLLTRLYDPDLWWLLAHGREMAASKSLLSAEIFSHTLANARFVNFEWLSGLVFYGAWSAAGPAGVLAIKVVAGMVVAALVAALGWRHGARGPWLIALSWIGFWVLRHRLNERAELATLIAIPAALLLVDYIRSDRRRWLPGFAFLFIGLVPAANAHGGWIFVPGLMLLRAVGAAWAREEGATKCFFIATAVSFAAGVANPYGLEIIGIQLLHLSRLQGGLSNRDLIEEWKPTTVEDAPYFWALYLLVMVVLVVGFRRKAKWASGWAPALLAFGLWGVHSYRNTALFVFPAVAFLAAAGPSLGDLLPFSWDRKLRAWFAVTVAAVLIALKAPVLARPLPTSLVQWNRYPVKACEFVRDAGIDGRMFNTLAQGGYIGWALGPERKIFCDGRYLFFPLVQDLFAALLRGEFGAFLEGWGVDHAIVDHHIADSLIVPGSGRDLRDLLTHEKWALVFWDDAAMVFLRREDRFERLIREREYLALSPSNPARLDWLSVEGVEVARTELERHRQEVGFSVIAAEMAAILNTVGR